MRDAAAAGTRPLTTEEVARLLRSTSDGLRSELGGLSDDVASWHPAAGEWCVKACLGHMIEAEARGFAGRIRRTPAEPGRHDDTWDQVRVQADRNDDGRPRAELLESFAGMRADSIRLVEGLLNTDLLKTCVHPEVGQLSVEDILHEWVHHDRNHFRQVLANIQDFTWPSMRNAQKFSSPA